MMTATISTLSKSGKVVKTVHGKVEIFSCLLCLVHMEQRARWADYNRLVIKNLTT